MEQELSRKSVWAARVWRTGVSSLDRSGVAQCIDVPESECSFAPQILTSPAYSSARCDPARGGCVLQLWLCSYRGILSSDHPLEHHRNSWIPDPGGEIPPADEHADRSVLQDAQSGHRRSMCDGINTRPRAALTPVACAPCDRRCGAFLAGKSDSGTRRLCWSPSLVSRYHRRHLHDGVEVARRRRDRRALAYDEHLRVEDRENGHRKGHRRPSRDRSR